MNNELAQCKKPEEDIRCCDRGKFSEIALTF